MSKSKLETSKENGHHFKLSQLAGSWEGTTKTWFKPDEVADTSPMKGTFRPLLDGNFMLHEYNGSMQGKPFTGMAIYGYNLSDGVFQSAWIDSFHMGSGILFSEGGDKDQFAATGLWNAGGEKWGWRTELDQKDANTLVITAYIIKPTGEESKATETVYTRKG